MLVEVFGLVAGLDDPGFNGNGGGARSGSELSHLCFPKCGISLTDSRQHYHLSWVLLSRELGRTSDKEEKARTWGPKLGQNQRWKDGASAPTPGHETRL